MELTYGGKRIDLLFLDIEMGEISGLEVFLYIQADRHYVSVIKKTVMIRYLLFLVPVIGWYMISAFVALYIHNGGVLVGISVFALVIFEIVNKMFPNIARFQITIILRNLP